MNINEKIVKYLEAKGISQSLLVKKTGISKQNLNRLLNSDDIKISQLTEITKALGLSFTYFFDGTEDISNEEMQGLKKRVAELEEMLSDKRHIIAEKKRKEVENVEKLLNEVLETECKALSDQHKKMAYKMVMAEAKSEAAGFLYDLSKRSEIIDLINNDLVFPNSPEGKALIKKIKKPLS